MDAAKGVDEAALQVAAVKQAAGSSYNVNEKAAELDEIFCSTSVASRQSSVPMATKTSSSSSSLSSPSPPRVTQKETFIAPPMKNSERKSSAFAQPMATYSSGGMTKGMFQLASPYSEQDRLMMMQTLMIASSQNHPYDGKRDKYIVMPELEEEIFLTCGSLQDVVDDDDDDDDDEDDSILGDEESSELAGFVRVLDGNTPEEQQSPREKGPNQKLVERQGRTFFSDFFCVSEKDAFEECDQSLYSHLSQEDTARMKENKKSSFGWFMAHPTETEPSNSAPPSFSGSEESMEANESGVEMVFMSSSGSPANNPGNRNGLQAAKGNKNRGGSSWYPLPRLVRRTRLRQMRNKIKPDTFLAPYEPMFTGETFQKPLNLTNQPQNISGIVVSTEESEPKMSSDDKTECESKPAKGFDQNQENEKKDKSFDLHVREVREQPLTRRFASEIQKPHKYLFDDADDEEDEDDDINEIIPLSVKGRLGVHTFRRVSTDIPKSALPREQYIARKSKPFEIVQPLLQPATFSDIDPAASDITEDSEDSGEVKSSFPVMMISNDNEIATIEEPIGILADGRHQEHNKDLDSTINESKEAGFEVSALRKISSEIVPSGNRGSGQRFSSSFMRKTTSEIPTRSSAAEKHIMKAKPFDLLTPFCQTDTMDDCFHVSGTRNEDTMFPLQEEIDNCVASVYEEDEIILNHFIGNKDEVVMKRTSSQPLTCDGMSVLSKTIPENEVSLMDAVESKDGNETESSQESSQIEKEPAVQKKNGSTKRGRFRFWKRGKDKKKIVKSSDANEQKGRAETKMTDGSSQLPPDLGGDECKSEDEQSRGGGSEREGLDFIATLDGIDIWAGDCKKDIVSTISKEIDSHCHAQTLPLVLNTKGALLPEMELVLNDSDRNVKIEEPSMTQAESFKIVPAVQETTVAEIQETPNSDITGVANEGGQEAIIVQEDTFSTSGAKRILKLTEDNRFAISLL